MRCAKQMLLQGSNRIPADANERFEDNFDDDAAILLQLIRSIISRQKSESVSKISKADTHSSSRSPAKNKTMPDEAAAINAEGKNKADLRALKYEMAKDALVEALSYDTEDRMGELKKTIVVAKAKKFCIQGANTAYTQEELFKVVEHMAEKMADGQSFFQELKKEKRNYLKYYY